MNDFIRAAQLNSAQGNLDRFGLDRAITTVHRAAEAARLDILIAGGEENPALYRELTVSGQRAAPFRRGKRNRETLRGPENGSAAPQVFLWYAALADNPVLQDDFRTVNYRGVPSLGWRSAARSEEAPDGPPSGVSETFSFACPNHPGLRIAVFEDLERQLAAYPFDGVFLDKIRYPSPANGLDEVFTCFCPYCRDAASGEGVDLNEVKALLERISLGSSIAGASGVEPSPAGWLEKLLMCLSEQDQAVLAEALRFRARSITRLVTEIQQITGRLGKKLALDLFSPGLAFLVGQDYRALAGLADWVKPMVYRRAMGPAGLRLEIPQLVRGLANFLHIGLGEAEKWMQTHVDGMAGTSLAEIEQDGPPLSLIATEMKKSIDCMGDTPVYMGVEAVSIPAFHIHITPEQVREMTTIAREAGARGIVLSWDLLSMPMENLKAVLF